MAKLNAVYATLLLLSISGALMAIVAGDKCQENVGVCNIGCGPRCRALHRGGLGICQGVGGQKFCSCSYDCNPDEGFCGSNCVAE